MTPRTLGLGTTLGYCTNVHAGATLPALQAALERHACAVRDHVAGPEGSLAIGLWIPDSALREARREVEAFRAWLGKRRLEPFTINGFPQGDFHEPVVKHRVYAPTWAREERLEYTLGLADLLVHLLPAGAEGSISTLPVAWGGALDAAGLEVAARQLARGAEALAELEAETGTLVHLDLEPEPGCHFDTARGAVAWIERVAQVADNEDIVRRHLRICHDVCHSGVMFEDQDEAFDAYAAAGVRVGKVQISSALSVAFDGSGAREGLCAPDRMLARTQLADFAEGRYLHQTVVRDAGGRTRLYEDLPAALADEHALGGTWRVHFHVPVHLDRIGVLSTTRDQIAGAVRRALAEGVRHFEVETYAWSVLPRVVASDDLATGIARELMWVAAECTP